MGGLFGLELDVYGRKWTFALQALFVAATGYLLYFGPGQPDQGPPLWLLALFAAVHLPLPFLPTRYFHQPGFYFGLVLANLAFLSGSIELASRSILESYYCFFLAFLVAAVSQHPRMVTLSAVATGANFGGLAYATREASLIGPFAGQILILALSGFLIAYLSQALQRQAHQHLQDSASALKLFELVKTRTAEPSTPDQAHLRIPHQVQTILGVELCELALIEGPHITRRFRNGRSEPEDVAKIRVDRSVHAEAIASGQLYTCSEFGRNANFSSKDDITFYPYRSYAAIGWNGQGAPSGLLSIFRKEALPWKEGELEKFRFLAALAALSLEHLRTVQKLESQAYTDGLCGLANYRYFLHRLEGELARAQRKNHPLALALIDLDGFKEINDTSGHLMGNKILQRVANILKTNARKMDVAARVGGDEFAVILPETSAQQAGVFAERVLREALAAGTELPRCSVSIGISTFPADSGQPLEFLQRADQALYQAKVEGGGCVHHYYDLVTKCSLGREHLVTGATTNVLEMPLPIPAARGIAPDYG